ncbi:hypothetical protein HRbin40_00891 [bacterium HR40]|nr:hypothetical protein HRbin40_00891 [bacterium HR40]
MPKRPADKAERGTRKPDGQGRAGTRAGSRRPVPRQEVVRLLAAGLDEREVATILDCDLRALRARIRRWGGVAELVARYRQESAESPEETYRRLVDLVYAHLERQVRNGNLRVLLWIADRLRLVRPFELRNAPDALEEKLAALAEEDAEFDHGED